LAARARLGHDGRVPAEQELRQRIGALEAELAQRVDDAGDQDRQLQRYAADLRETFLAERRRSQELHRSYMLTVRALASAVEARDAYTGRHAERVAAYGLALGEVYGLQVADEPQTEFGFLLHDIGKVAVPDAILFKPGPLTMTERLVMQQHPVTGWEIVRDIDFLGAARDVIRSHHERWDGDGYPDGTAGPQTPVSARVFAVADTLDALTTQRPYRAPSTLAQAREIIDEGAGTHFDPDVIAAFRELPDTRIEQIRTAIG